MNLKRIAVLSVLCGLFLSCSKSNAENLMVDFSTENTDFKVVSVNPSGELPTNIKNPSIQILFSEPVVALEKLGEQSEKNEIVEITPKLKGNFKWIGTSLLSFDCEESILPLKEYKIQINPDSVSKKGNKISGKLTFKFFTEDFKLSSIISGFDGIEKGILFPDDEVPLEYAKNVALYFTAPVDADVVKNYISVTDSFTFNELKFKITNKQEKSFNIEILDELKPNQNIKILLKQGAKATKDSRENSKEYSESFNTIKDLKVEYTDLESQSYGKYSNPVKFTFNHQLKENSEEEIANLISTTPEMKITKENIKIFGRTLMIFNLPVKYESKYSLKIKPGIQDIYSIKTTDELNYDIQVPKALSFVTFKDYGFKMLESEFEPKLVFEYQNILPDSMYTLETVRGVSDNFNAKTKNKLFTPNSIPKDTKVIEEIPLKENLENFNGKYRGTVKFSANIKYKSRYRDWQTKEIVEQIYENGNLQYIQVTDLGLTVRYGYNKVLILVTNISSGEPVENAEVFVYKNTFEDFSDALFSNPEIYKFSKTDKNGLAVVDIKDFSFKKNDWTPLIVEAKTNDDRALFFPSQNFVYNENWDCGRLKDANKEKQVTFIFTDRGLYKPGEKVTFRGYDKTLKNEKYSEYVGKFSIQLADQNWNPEIYLTDYGTTSESGTFWGSFTIPEDFKPGNYNIQYQRNDYKSKEIAKCPIQVEFFEKLRFEAKATIPDLEYFSGDKIITSISAQYLGGGSLTGATYKGNWLTEPEGFSAKSNNFKDLTFGPVIGYDGRNWLNDANGTLNGLGKAQEQIQSGNERIKGMAYRYKFNANITDSGNQMIGTSSSVLVHPALFYIGVSDIKNIDGFAKFGETLTFDYFCLTPQEKIADSTLTDKDSSIKIELLREDWKQVQQLGWNGEINTRYQREIVTDSESKQNLVFNEKGTRISVKPSQCGSYILRLSTKDKFGREIITEKRFFVTGSDWIWFNRENSSEIEMTCDKELYNIGEKAQILINSPLPKGKYLMTIEREGIIEEKIINLETSSQVIEIPVEENYLPLVYVTFSSYSTRNKKPNHDFSTPDLDKPKGFFGSTMIKVSTKLKEFDISVIPEKRNYRPGEEAKIKIKATQNGNPLENAEITVMAVDRGVIDLINYHVKNPAKFFYSSENFLNYCAGGESRNFLIDPVTYEVRNLFGGDASESLTSKDEISTRKNFEPTAIFEPQIITDSNGEAELSFTLPDNLTSYRITAVGILKDKFAITENELPVTNPISACELLPRKLRIDDKSEIGVLLTNMTEKEEKISVECKIYSGLEKTGYEQKDSETIKTPGFAKLTGTEIKEINVPQNSTKPLTFELKAEKAGWISVEFTIISDILKEKLIKGLEIDEPYIFEQVATTGQITDSEENVNSAKEFIKIPSNIKNNKGNFSVILDSTKLGPLSSSVDYVFNYPYGCLEQRSAKILPLIAFSDYISVFNLNSKVVNPEKIAVSEIKEWKKSQLPSGAFPYWPGSTYENFFVSCRIAEILGIAKEKGYDIYDFVDVEKLCNYIQNQINIYKNSDSDIYDIKQYSYAVYVLSALGKKVQTEYIDYIVDNDFSDFAELCYAGLSYIYNGEFSKSDIVKNLLLTYIQETSRGINIPSENENSIWQYYQDKNTENLSLALMYFSEIDSTNRLIPKIIHSLLTHESAKKGYYKSTSSTARVLISVANYIQNSDLENSDFNAILKINQNQIGNFEFKGLVQNPVEINSDFSSDLINSLKRDTDIPVEIEKSGKGSLFYTMLLKYALLPQDQIAREMGICIFTEMIDTETGKIVKNQTLDSSKIYKKIVHISTPKDREFVAVRVPVPSGCEIMNAAFTTTVEISDNSKKDLSETKFNSLSNQEIYDNEVQYFWNIFSSGSKTVEFYFRPVRKGEFTEPSALATCMYEEEIFGRTQGNVWKIK